MYLVFTDAHENLGLVIFKILSICHQEALMLCSRNLFYKRKKKENEGKRRKMNKTCVLEILLGRNERKIMISFLSKLYFQMWEKREGNERKDD